MELQGKIIAALPERSGTNARGDWKLQEFVLETHEAYPKKIVFSVFGADRLQRFNIQVNQEVLLSFDIDAHEYQGRWYNSVRAYDVRPYSGQVGASTAAPYAAATTPSPAAPIGGASAPTYSINQNDPVDDLPF